MTSMKRSLEESADKLAGALLSPTSVVFDRSDVPKKAHALIDPSYFPFLTLSDDCLGEVASWLALPEISDFAVVSKQFSKVVTMGFCFESLAVQLFPKIGELRDAIGRTSCSILSGGRWQKKSFGAVLKQQKIAGKQASAEYDLSSRHCNPHRRELVNRSLEDNFAFNLLFDIFVASSDEEKVGGIDEDNKEGGEGGREKKRTGVVLRTDAGVVSATWTFPDEYDPSKDVTDQKRISLSFDVRAKNIEFPPLWPALKTFGSPQGSAFKAEEARRRACSFADLDLFKDVVPGIRHNLKVFVLDKATGETAVLVKTGIDRVDESWLANAFIEWDDEDCNLGLFEACSAGWFEVSRGGEYIPPWMLDRDADRYCAITSPRPVVTPSAKFQLRLHAENAGDVPELRCKVEEISLSFETGWDIPGDSNPTMSMSAVAVSSIFMHLFT